MTFVINVFICNIPFTLVLYVMTEVTCFSVEGSIPLIHQPMDPLHKEWDGQTFAAFLDVIVM
jgi:hypothetical protein